MDTQCSQNDARTRTADPAEYDILVAAKNGDTVAFEILCQQSAGMVSKIARRIMRSKEDAEDVVQESFQLAFVHLNSFKGDSRFSTWLSTIATNAARMRLRRSRVRRELSLDELSERKPRPAHLDIQDHGLDPERLYAQNERQQILAKAMNALTPGMRRAIELRDLDERSTEETARIMGISGSAVKARVFHGRRKLRRLFHRYSKSTQVCGSYPRRMDRKPHQALGPHVAFSAGD